MGQLLKGIPGGFRALFVPGLTLSCCAYSLTKEDYVLYISN